MKITSVSVHLGRKVTRNYNSFDNSVGICADLTDGENHREAILQLQKECLQQLFREDPLEARHVGRRQRKLPRRGYTI